MSSSSHGRKVKKAATCFYNANWFLSSTAQGCRTIREQVTLPQNCSKDFSSRSRVVDTPEQNYSYNSAIEPRHKTDLSSLQEKAEEAGRSLLPNVPVIDKNVDE